MSDQQITGEDERERLDSGANRLFAIPVARR
jgi:hypothetical protein